MADDNKLASHRTRGDTGASLVEYALLVALIAMVSLTAMTYLGSSVEADFKNLDHQGFSASGGILCTPANPNFPDC